MRSARVVAQFLVVIAHLTEANDQTRGAIPPGPFLWEKLQAQAPAAKVLLKGQVDPEKALKAQSLRVADNCSFPLDIVIMQDATASFDDNIAAMRDTQLALIHEGITRAHPESRFGVATFRDKPLWSLGDPDEDYCTRFDVPLTTDFDKLVAAYADIDASFGADAPENQFGALYNVLTSSQTGWREDAGVTTKLVIISTDAGPHFGGDSQTGMLPPFDGTQTDDENRAVCLRQYYPTPEQMREKILDSGAYVASLVYDGDWANGWAAKSWVEFNKFIGQPAEFVAPQAPDSSDFWAQLAKVLTVVENIECGELATTTSTPTTTAAPTTTASSTTTAMTTAAPATTPTPLTTAAPTTTGATATAAPSSTSLETSVETTELPVVTITIVNETQTTNATRPTDVVTVPATPCVCPCENCTCCPEMVIEFRQRPKVLRMDVVN